MRRLIAVTACAALVLAGCGRETGGGSEQGAASDPATTAAETRPEGPTRAQYIARADAFCAEVASSRQGVAVAKSFEKVRRIPRDDPAFSRQAAAHFTKVLNLARSFSDEFKAIKPPPADRERIEVFHRANDEAIARLEEVVQAFERRDDPEQALQAYGSALGNADRLAEAYGFEVCARVGERES